MIGSALVQAFEFEGHELNTYSFRGRPCWIGQDIGAVLGYTVDGWRSALGEWGDELTEGQDTHTLRDAELREFKAGLDPRAKSALGKTAQMTVLFESGIYVVCLKTNKDMGKRLRRFLADVVLPGLRRGTLDTSDAAKELISLTLRLEAMKNAETVWETATINEICRLYNKPRWDGRGRFPHWIQEPLGKIYKIVLGEDVYRELKKRNPDPRDGSLNYQFLTEARHELWKQRDMENVSTVLILSNTRENFFNDLEFKYNRRPRQLRF